VKGENLAVAELFRTNDIGCRVLKASVRTARTVGEVAVALEQPQNIGIALFWDYKSGVRQLDEGERTTFPRVGRP
jgi:hypothetical protein